MKVCGIIAEYNPFHLGHQYQIHETKEAHGADFVIAIMSPNFVQRGEPAIFDQFTRTKLALAGGADLVIQLPTAYATSSAETFAYGSVSLLNDLQVCDHLCFGSESGDIQHIASIADFLSLEPANYKNALRSELKKGLSYPKSRDLALKATYHGDSTLMKGSNNILAIEYLKSLNKLQSSIKPITIKRQGASYLDEDFSHVLPSASAIRKFFKESSRDSFTPSKLEKAMPTKSLEQLEGQDLYHPIYMDHLYPSFQYLLEIFDYTYIKAIYDFPEQLYNRLREKSRTHKDYKSFIEDAQSKNYTRTTIQRSLMHLYLNIKSNDLDKLKRKGHQYIRVLGFRKEASPVLKHIKQNSHLTLVTNVKDHYKHLSTFGQDLLNQEIAYTNIYHQKVLQQHHIKKNNDYRQPIIVV